MCKEKSILSAPVHAVVMQLFEQQALTISKSGTEVSIHCESGSDANAVFDWLVEIGENTEVDPVGWKIIATGNDGSVLCESPIGRRCRFWFVGKPKSA